MTDHHRLELSVDPTLPLFRARREFDFPADEVFRAHVDPALVVQWLGPRRLAMRVDEWDCRTGGAYRYAHLDEDGSEYAFFGSFHEVVAPRRIVQTFTFGGEPETVALQTLELEDLGSRRSCLRVVFLTASTGSRDAFLQSGMEEGATQSYERLAELHATGALASALARTP